MSAYVYSPVHATPYGPGQGHGTIAKPLVVWDEETYLCFDPDDGKMHLYTFNPIEFTEEEDL